MKLGTTSTVLVLGLALAASGCAHRGGGAATTAETVAPPSEKACFNVREVRSYDALDDRHVYVETIRDGHYLLTLDTICIGLASSIRIAISNDFSRVCSNDLAVITYRNFDRLESCRILDVERVADREAAVGHWRARVGG